jgi:small subunit ribosomal protein S21
VAESPQPADSRDKDFPARAALCYDPRSAGAAISLRMPSSIVKTVRRPRKGSRLLVQVRDNNVDQALRALKKKMQREGIFREMKLRNHYEKPSERKARESAEAVRRARKLARKRAQREL